MLIFLRDNLAKIVGVALAWLAFAILRQDRMLVKAAAIFALRPGFCRSTKPPSTLSESEFESLTYHHVSQLSNSRDALARRWLLRWGGSVAELFSCCLAIARLGIAFRSVIASTG
ncbi:FUSC family protein [Escherichia coli]|nr:FUSC family protein [Escherichia coli]